MTATAPDLPLSSTAMTQAAGVVRFWKDAGFKAWFTKDADFDLQFRDRFLTLHLAAARGECASWLNHPESALALMVLLDQFPRNAFRGTPHMFGTDALALKYAKQLVATKGDLAVDEALRAFVYLPFEHAESLDDQKRSVDYFSALGGEWVKYAIEHHDIIERFGRFPHRNAILGRTSTAAEIDYLEKGGFAG